MADLTPQERLQPSLLDRLTDSAPDTKRESRDRRVLSMRRLRSAVLRDLAWLLNTGHLETTGQGCHRKVRAAAIVGVFAREYCT